MNVVKCHLSLEPRQIFWIVISGMQAEVARRRMMTWGGRGIATVLLSIGICLVDSHWIQKGMSGERVRGRIG